MENKESLWSRLFKRKRPQEAPPAQSPATPISSPEQPLGANAQEREERLKERQKQKAQGAFSHTVEQAQSGQEIAAPPGTGPLELQKSTQKIATEQSIEKGEELREKFAPKGTPGERFRRLTQSEIKDTSPPVAKPVGETLSERRTREIDRELLAKSITKPTWPKEKAQEKTPVEQKGSVPPFEPGTFPGVEKWQPGKGAISIDEAKKIREKLKNEQA